MTRINASLNIKSLSDEHLLAEHREIKRICNRFKQRIANNNFSGIPLEFKLGKGHELFFLDKGEFTLKRYNLIHDECLLRKFNVQNFANNWKIYYLYPKYFNDWIPTEKETGLIKQRIKQNILTGKKEFYHYYGKKISQDSAIKLL
jgi:hypothetical protein